MDPHNTVVNLPTVTVPLPADSHRFLATFGGARFIYATDCLRMGMVLGHDLLASISQLLLIPLDGFEKALQRPRRRVSLQRDGLGGFAVQIGQLSFNIDSQQPSPDAPAKAVCKQRQKQTQLPSQCPNLL